MNATDVRELIQEAISIAVEASEEDVITQSFSEAMVMTNNEGLMVYAGDSVFQVTVVQAR